MKTNHMSIDDRVKIGKAREKKIIGQLVSLAPKANGVQFLSFRESSREEDMKDKIDAWGLADDGRQYSIQIKHREGMPDLGVAAIRPYTTDEGFCFDYQTHTLRLDRDMIAAPDFYVNSDGEKICVVSGDIVKRAVTLMLEKLYLAGGFRGNKWFASRDCPGAELRLVEDIGSGYTKGQFKIMCYINPFILQRAGAYLGAI